MRPGSSTWAKCDAFAAICSRASKHCTVDVHQPRRTAGRHSGPVFFHLEGLSVTPAERSLYGKLGAHISWAKTPDRPARTRPARNGLERKFEREADPNNELTPAERAKRTEHVRKAYYARLALKSAQARRRRASSRPEAPTGKVRP